MGTPTLDAVCAAAGRGPEELTRRDVALVALLATPTEDRLATIAALRRELLAAGNPLSNRFWAGCELMLSRMAGGAATVGDVRRWLEATGSEPTQLLPGGFVWDDEQERKPIAREMHRRLVAHLEGLVADGTIDPDRLLTGDPAAVSAYRQVQLQWLETPLADGRQPMMAVSDD